MPALSPAARSWALGLAATAVGIGLLTAAGAFAPAERQPGVEAAPGELIELTRWDVVVESCAYFPPWDDDPEEFGDVEVLLTVTNTSDRTLDTMGSSTYALTLPNGDELGGETSNYTSFMNPDTYGGFDPGFTRSAVISGDLLTPHWEGDGNVLLRFASETQSDGFLLSGDWVADRQAAYVSVPCPEGEFE